ncbi:MAG: hypothetical protein AAB595_02180 [Patescibacteria group bacterium]
MTKNKNIAVVISLLSAIIVFAENYFNIFNTMVGPDAYTIFVLLRSVAVLGAAFVAYLCFRQNKKEWFWVMGITALWINASLSASSTALIPSLINLIALGILVTSLFGLKLDEKIVG